MKILRVDDEAHYIVKKYAGDMALTLPEATKDLFKRGYRAVLDAKIDGETRMTEILSRVESPPVFEEKARKPRKAATPREARGAGDKARTADDMAHAAVDKLERVYTQEEIDAVNAEREARFIAATKRLDETREANIAEAHRRKAEDDAAWEAREKKGGNGVASIFSAYAEAAAPAAPVNTHPDYPFND